MLPMLLLLLLLLLLLPPPPPLVGMQCCNRVPEIVRILVPSVRCHKLPFSCLFPATELSIQVVDSIPTLRPCATTYGICECVPQAGFRLPSGWRQVSISDGNHMAGTP